MQPSVHRRARSRNQMMEGLVLQGMNTAFGKIGVFLLLLLGVFLVATKRQLDTRQFQKFTVHAMSKPYQPGMGNNKKQMVAIPVMEGKKLLLVQYQALASTSINSVIEKIQVGDSLVVWMDSTNAALFLSKGSGGIAEIVLLSNGDTPIISETAYNKVLGSGGSVGWGLILLSASMIPYFFIRNPKLSPLYTFLLVLMGLLTWWLVP